VDCEFERWMLDPSRSQRGADVVFAPVVAVAVAAEGRLALRRSNDVVFAPVVAVAAEEVAAALEERLVSFFSSVKEPDPLTCLLMLLRENARRDLVWLLQSVL